MSADLVTFLRARLAEDEQAARAAPGNSWTAHTQDSVSAASVYDEQWRLLEPEHYDHDEPLSDKPGATGPGYINRARDELAAHIARWDPARVLAEVDAKRAITVRYEFACDQADHPWHSPDERAAWEKIAGALELCVQDLMLPYADHPDYPGDDRGSQVPS